MIKIVADFFVKQEFLEKALWLTQDVVEKTRKEDGCLQYEVYRDKKDPGHLVFIEEWESQEAVDNHSKSMHFLNFVPRMKEMQSKDFSISVLERAV